MAIYHCSIKIIGRTKEKSAVGSAAYRAGERIKNDYDGLTHDFTKKTGIIHKEILLPDHAPREYLDRTVLWNAVERIDKAKNAQLARDIELALPVELPMEQNINLALEYVKEHFVSAGMCADVCIHDTGKGNPHAHVMLTMRPIEPDGCWGAKSRKEYILNGNGDKIRLPSGEYKSRKVCTVDWNEQTKAEQWREGWANTVNKYLSKNGIKVRIDHRSYERQGVEKHPSIHMGVAACQMEKKGIRTERGDINREVALTNSEIGQLQARIRKQKEFWYAQPLENAPTMFSLMENIAAGKNTQNQWDKVKTVKTQASVLLFLQQNGIGGVEQLVGRITAINDEFKEVADEIKKGDRRSDTLAQHLAQYDNYKQHKAVHDEYGKLKGKKAEAFYDKHFEKIQSYEAAKKYLDGVMNGNTIVPVKAWQAEQNKLAAKKFTLCEKYYSLQEEVQSVELLRKGAENLMREDRQQERQYTRAQGIVI
jgi:ATP-dependent exoDNAse (exonuclease V) alpha subunit